MLAVLLGNICIRGKGNKEEKRKDITTLGSPVTVMHGVILWWWTCTWLFVVSFFIVSSLPSVTTLEDLYGACSRKFMIFCAGAVGGW